MGLTCCGTNKATEFIPKVNIAKATEILTDAEKRKLVDDLLNNPTFTAMSEAPEYSE